jgi:hypothetical protein
VVFCCQNEFTVVFCWTLPVLGGVGATQFQKKTNDLTRPTSLLGLAACRKIHVASPSTGAARPPPHLCTMESNFIENGAVFVKISKIDGFAGSSKTGRLNLNF